MNTRQVGPFKVNPIGLGCMNICPVYGPPPPEADAQKLLLAALDEGVDFLTQPLCMVLVPTKLWWVRFLKSIVKNSHWPASAA